MPNANDHDRCIELLASFGISDLSSDDRAFVQRHLDDCSTCRDFAAAKRDLLQVWREDYALASRTHVSEEVLVQYADRPNELESSIREKVEAHLTYCDPCATELQLLHDLAAQLSQASPAPIKKAPSGTNVGVRRLLWTPLFGYAVAAVVTLLLGYPAWQWMAVSDNEALVPPNDIVIEEVHHLTEQTRNTNGVTEIFRSDERTIRLVFNFWSDPDLYYTVSVKDSAGKTIAERPLGDEAMRRGTGQVAIRSELLVDGRYLLDIAGIKLAESADTVRIRFPFRMTSED